MSIILDVTEGLFTHTLYDVTLEILKKDPIRSAIDQTIDELTREKQSGWYELREIDRNQKEIFNNINIIEEATFLKILTENDVLPETASKLYKKFSEKFNGIINEAALKKSEIFYPYVIREFEKINTDNKELIKLLTGFAHKNEVYLDRIIKHFKDLEKIPNIPDIQSVLRKGEISDGEFFRKEPAWVDYEQGFIVERKEVDEIIKKLEKDKVQLVLGAPASGKSIILKNVGYKLAYDGKKVYVIELKKHSQDEIKLFFDNIPKIDDDYPIFIVDDVHLYLSDCERLIRNFRRNGKGNLIIGSRKTREITEGDPTVSSEFEHLSKTAIITKAEDVTEEMIKIFLGQKHSLSDERIKFVSGILDKFKKDLWYLSWALKAYKPEKNTVEEDTIYEMIKERIKIIKAEDVFLPLSVFYRYEIPIEKKFLENKLGVKKMTIEQLIGLSEIVKTEEKGKPIMLSLNHSSLAELYFGAYQSYPSLGEIIKEKLLNGKDKEELEFCSFYRYLTSTDPINSVDIVIYLRRNWVDEKNIKTLLEKLTDEEKIQDSIILGIEKEENIETVRLCISTTIKANRNIGLKLAKSIDIDVLSAKIEREEHIDKIGLFVSKASKEWGLKLIDRISINRLSEKIKKEEKIGKIGQCIMSIAEASKETGLKLVDSIDTDALSAKMKQEKDIKKIGNCVMGIAKVSKEVGLKFFDRINIDVLSVKIDKEKNINRIKFFLLLIVKASKEAGLKLANSIDIDSLSVKIDKEENIHRIRKCISVMVKASEEMGLRLVDKIDIDALSSKIDKGEIIAHIGECISVIARTNKEKGLRLANSIDVDALSAKIDKEENIAHIGECVSNIEKASKEVAKEIVNRLNPRKIEELLKKYPSLSINN